MNEREAFEAWYKNNFGEPDFLRGACGTYYMNSSVDFAWQTWKAALASQAQQPKGSLAINNLAKQILSDCGFHADHDKDVYHRIRSRIIESQAQQSQAARLLLLKLEIERICDDVKYSKDAKLAIQKLDFSKAASLPPAPEGGE